MSETYTPDTLIAGLKFPVSVEDGTLALGQNRARGTVLGKILLALGDAEADSGNTGEGSIEDVSLGHGCELGIYTLTCIDATGAAPIFSVVNPSGVRLADATADVAYTGQINFTLESYGTDFDEGDIFTVEVEAGSGQLAIADSNAVNGLQTIIGVLAEDCDASLAATACVYYQTGEFNTTALTLTTGDTVEDFRADALKLGIYFYTNQAA